MTAHELANILLQQEDVPVVWHYYHDDADCYMYSYINHVELYDGTLHLFENEKDSPTEVERRRIEYECEWDAECRRRAEEEAKKITWGKLLSLTSKEVQEAFLSFLGDDYEQKRYVSLEIDPERISYLLSLHLSSNARLTKDYMNELATAAEALGLEIDPRLIAKFDHYVSIVRYNTESEQLAALKAARNNNK